MLALIGLVGLLAGGCLMPRQGTPVFVDMRAGDFWSGEGLLIETSADGLRCRVAVRDRALWVRKRWVDCVAVHARSSRQSGLRSGSRSGSRSGLRSGSQSGS